MNLAEILIVEDEILICETLKIYLQEFGYQIKNFAISYEEALKCLEQPIKPDLILIDIRLYGEKSGIDLANYLNKSDLNIPYIFLTSQFDKRLLTKALETNPSAYLVKPIQKRTLISTVALALSENNQELNQAKKIQIKDGKINHLIFVKHITYVESDHIYCKIYLEDSTSIHTRNSLIQLMNAIDYDNILRCHRSFLVNCDFVTKWDSNLLVLESGEAIPISRSFRNEVLLKLS